VLELNARLPGDVFELGDLAVLAFHFLHARWRRSRLRVAALGEEAKWKQKG